jgi:hypothetical protein
MPVQGLPKPTPSPSWSGDDELQTIGARICEVTIQAIVKKYRHGGGTFWEYSIQESDKEVTSGTDFETDEEARKVALEKFTNEIQVVLRNLNIDL